MRPRLAPASTPVRLVLASCLAAATVGCPAPLSRGARAQDAAQELNVNTRFGRLEIAIEKVAPKEKDAFARRHHDWGGDIRIADSEMAGMHLTADENAEVSVKVAWFRPAEGELHVTTIRQKWHDYRGDWLLVGEERAEGQEGLLGEKIEAPPEVRSKTSVQFPTIRIGQGDRAD